MFFMGIQPNISCFQPPIFNPMAMGANPFMGGSLFGFGFPMFNPNPFAFGVGMPFMPIFPFPSFSGKVTITQTSEGASSNIEGETLSKKAYGKAFLDKVKQIAKDINCNYRDLLAIMKFESGISTTKTNKTTGATGLIQFMPDTAQHLGTSTDALRKMSPIDQLDYVEKYIKEVKRNAGFGDNEKLSAGQLYALIFRPAYAKSGVVARKGEKAYSCGGNSNLDVNQDNKITTNELAAIVRTNYVNDNSFLA